MILAFNLLVALVGLVLGGLANLLADDLPNRRSPRSPRCPHCDHPRRPAAWSGIGAFVLGRRHCESCAQLLSWRYPIVELALAAGFIFVWNRFGLTADGLFTLLYVWLAVLIAVIDVEHRLILNIVMGPALLLALAEAILTPRLSVRSTLTGGAVGFGFMFGVYLLGVGFRVLLSRLRGEALTEVAFGFGDVTLATFAGLVVGGGRGVSLMLTVTILAGGVIALVYFVYRRFIRRDYTLFTPIPYGPNILFGMLLVLIWRQDFGEAARRAIYGP